MQLSQAILRRAPKSIFSTLYGSKWVATRYGRPFHFPNVQFSVPSTGRSGLQQEGSEACKAFISVFSTLYGSKWVATVMFVLWYGWVLIFSTLYGSKWVATGLHLPIPASLNWFSVPSTGRSGLQPALSRALVRAAIVFSTLYGSKWVATFQG